MGFTDCSQLLQKITYTKVISLIERGYYLKYQLAGSRSIFSATDYPI